MTERQIHEQFIAWLRKLEIPYVHHRMDKKSGIRTGWPDFTILWCSRVMCIEIKTAKGRITLDQARVIAFIRRSGNRVEICRSCEECVEVVKNILCEGKLGDDSVPEQLRPKFIKEFMELKQAVEAVPGNGTAEEKPKFRIGNWKGTDFVFAPDQRGEYRVIRPASAADII